MSKRRKNDSRANAKNQGDPKARSYVKQTDAPRRTLEEALAIARAIADHHACEPTTPLLVAQAAGLSPSGSTFRQLCGASIAYGITDGGCNANVISLTERGRRTVAPTAEGEEMAAMRDAALEPRLFDAFLRKYDGHRLPRPEIAQNVLADLRCPRDRARATYDVLVANAKHAGFFRDIKGDLYVHLASSSPASAPTDETAAPLPAMEATGEAPPEPPGAIAVRSVASQCKVFVAHGRNKKVLEQLQDLLRFGKFEPVVAEQEESTSQPVPDKVFGAMRECSAGILHVATEEVVPTPDGDGRRLKNENVLIEIGAAIALYGRNFILLVERGLDLPSNLQGLHRIDYDGEELGYEATMRLLKAMNKFQPGNPA